MNPDISIAASPGDALAMIPAAARHQTALHEPTGYPFLRLPIELRKMVYRELLVSPHRIHLECLRPCELECFHRVLICTSILRVCRQISNEALDVLYGENEFVLLGDRIEPMVVGPNEISKRNRPRLRMLSMSHWCFVRGINLDPEDGDDSYWIPESDSEAEDDSSNSYESNHGLGDMWVNLDSSQQFIAAEGPWFLQACEWKPIFENLTRLTITLQVDCCHWDESIISDDERLNRYMSWKIKMALRFYDVHVPDTVEVHRRVWCRYHKCCCVKERKKCARIRQYVKERWLAAC